MTNPPDANDFPAKLARLETLIQQAERLPDPAARAHARELVRALLELHATGIEQMLNHVADAGEPGGAILDACAADEVVGGLLLLHGLHPLDLDDRVRHALEQVQPLLESHGGHVELLGLDDGIVRVRVEASCDGCTSTAVTIRKAVEEALLARAPDVTAIEIEGLEAAESNGRVALPLI